ncbi:chain-length determining protein [Pseudomonas sp. BBP2017]|nr:chain-length determining protein [Pseudomonas sp. BBP2017]
MPVLGEFCPFTRQAFAVTSVSRVSSVHHAQDEIDLFNILQSLWRRKALIGSVGILCAVLGAVYAYLVTPVYEVNTVLRPVALNDLDLLNRSKIYNLPPEKALKRVGAALDSYDTRWNFFRSRPELIEAYSSIGGTPEQAFSNFNHDALKVVQPDPKKTELLSAYIGVKMRYEKGLDGAAILNDFVTYAVERERLQLTEDLQVIIGNRLAEIDANLKSAVSEYEAKKQSRIARLVEEDDIKRAQLQDELKALRVQLKMRREARLAQLDEAITIARSLGLKRPSTPSAMADESLGNANVIRTEVNSQQIPLYFLGADVLEAERNTLRKRSSDDFTEPRVAQIRKELMLLASNRQVESLKARKNEAVFLEGIESLRVERMRLQGIDTDMKQLRLVSIDQQAVAPNRPIKPRKVLIVAFALAGGLLLGAIIALTRGMFKSRLRQMRTLEIEGSAERVVVPGMVRSGVNS